jgi:hypothetical protein
MNKQIGLGILGFSTLLLSCDPAYSVPKVDIKGGRYHIFINDVQEPGYYNLDTTAKEAAVNLSFECDCVVTIKQPELTVTTSIVVITEPLSSIRLTWDIPTQREDGSVLLQDEIKGYIIKVSYNGEPIAPLSVTGLSTLVENLSPGNYEFSIATIAEQVGSFSPTIIEVIE